MLSPGKRIEDKCNFGRFLNPKGLIEIFQTDRDRLGSDEQTISRRHLALLLFVIGSATGISQLWIGIDHAQYFLCETWQNGGI